VTEYLILLGRRVSKPVRFAGRDQLEALPSDALLALRKYLIGGRITALRKSLPDRVVFLEIDNCRLSEQPERFGLALELIPNRARACLLDAQQQVQVWLSSAPGQFGTYSPPVMPACRVDSIKEDEFRSLFEQAGDVSGLSCIFGLSSWFAAEVIFQGRQDSARPGKRCKRSSSACRAAHTRRESTMLSKLRSLVEDPSRTPRTKRVIAPFALDSRRDAVSVVFFHERVKCRGVSSIA
jgi:predicted ribosome quality control (RQC) complex YloA/Tae2 family protein